MKKIVFGLFIIMLLSFVSAEDYSNCNIKTENYCPNSLECQIYLNVDCSCGEYKNAYCPDGITAHGKQIKIIEKIKGTNDYSCNFTRIDGTTFTQNSVPENLDGIYIWTCEEQRIDVVSNEPYTFRWGGEGNFTYCEADSIKRGIWITNDSICVNVNSMQLNEDKIINLSKAVISQNKEIESNNFQRIISWFKTILNHL